MKTFTVPMMFTVAAIDGIDDQGRATMRIKTLLERLCDGFGETTRGVDWEFAWSEHAESGVAVSATGLMTAKVTTPAELIEALDGLHTLAIENLGDDIAAPYVEALGRAIAAIVNITAIKRPTS